MSSMADAEKKIKEILQYLRNSSDNCVFASMGDFSAFHLLKVILGQRSKDYVKGKFVDICTYFCHAKLSIGTL